MRRIHIYINPRTHEITVEHDALTNMEIFQALGKAIKLVHDNILEEEARRRNVEASDIEKVVRLMMKQKNPKLN